MDFRLRGEGRILSRRGSLRGNSGGDSRWNTFSTAVTTTTTVPCYNNYDCPLLQQLRLSAVTPCYAACARMTEWARELQTKESPTSQLPRTWWGRRFLLYFLGDEHRVLSRPGPSLDMSKAR